MRKFFKHIAIALNLVPEPNDEQRLKILLNQVKKERLVEDIIAIRRSGDYIPDYNKPQVFLEYDFFYEEFYTVKRLATNVILKCHRTETFENANEWLAKIQAEHKKEVSYQLKHGGFSSFVPVNPPKVQVQ